MSNPMELNWKEAEEHLRACEEEAHSFDYIYIVSPLIDRFKMGERTKDLHQAITQIEL